MSAKLENLSENEIKKKRKKSTRTKKRKTTKRASASKTRKASASKVKKVEVILGVPEPDKIDEKVLSNIEPESVLAGSQKKKRTIKNIKPSKKAEELFEKTAEKIAMPPKKKRTLHLNINFGREIVVEEPKPIKEEIVEEQIEEQVAEVIDEPIIENVIDEPIESPVDEVSPTEEVIEEAQENVTDEITDEVSDNSEENFVAEIKAEPDTTFVIYEAPKKKEIDTEVNQNSPFFYGPSIFEKFGLEISSADDETFSKPIANDIKPSTEITPEPKPIEAVKEEPININPETVAQDIDSLIEELNKPVNENAENVQDKQDDITNAVIDEIINSDDDMLFDVEDLIDKTSTFDSVTPVEEPASEEANKENDSLIENVIDELTEAADSIETLEAPNPATVPVAAEVVAAPKIKRPASSIFKKFSFDEAVMQKAVPDLTTPIIPETVLPITDVVNTDVTANNIVSDTIIPEVQVTADPVKVATPAQTDVNIAVADTEEKPEVIAVVNDNKPNSPISIDEELVEKILDEEKKANPEEDSVFDDDNQEEVDEEPEEIDYENSNSLDNLPELEEDSSEEDDELDIEEYHLDDNIDYDTIVEEAEKQKEAEEKTEKNDSDDSFSIESYFGLDNISNEEESKEDSEDAEEPVELDISPIDDVAEEDQKNSPDFDMIAKLLETFNDSINTLSDKISELDEGKAKTIDTTSPISSNEADKKDEPEISDDDLVDLLINDESLLEESKEEPKEDSQEPEANVVEDILSDVLLSEDSNVNDEMRNDLISEVLSAEKEINPESAKEDQDSQIDTDFAKVLECLTKAITDLEETKPAEPASKEEPIVDAIETSGEELSEPDAVVEEEPLVVPELETESSSEGNQDGKSVNILIDHDDIFSIQILNETYEIMADFDSISVISENLNISTPKNNFYVKIGEKYIEIHNNKTFFTVQTNFEDIEFANAINNVGFAKKHNRIELNIKEAFKLSSVNNKVELSMLNKTIASIKDVPVTEIDEKSLSDNRTLIISEETQKVYLPYTISEIMNKLKYNDNYKSLQDVVDNEYTVPLSAFKMPIVSRFREAYRFMRTKEKSSVYAAIDLAVELMFNSNLDPAIIRAAKDLKELNVYLDCLYENEVDKFDCFKIVYKVLPKIK